MQIQKFNNDTLIMTGLTDVNLSAQNQDNCSLDKANEQKVSAEVDPILCPHCLRTASNGIKCRGICVSDSDY